MISFGSWQHGLLIASIGISTGCRTESAPTPPNIPAETKPALTPATAAQSVTPSETSDGNYFVTYTPKPNPIPLNELFTMEVDVFQDANLQQRPSGIIVEVDAGMPAHHHGMNLAPRVQPVSDGRFQVSGMLFHMPGQWEIYIDVSKDDKKERARFEVEIQ